jgi:cytochrome c oxidase subunit I+III
VISDRKMTLGRPTFWLMFLGFHVGFFPMHFTGLLGMPRRVYTYPEGLGWEWLNLTSTVGAFFFATGVLLFVIDVVQHFRRGEKVGRNPWNAGTLDWMMEIPPKEWGARSVPIVTTRYPLWQQKNFLDDLDNGRFLIPDAPDLRRETIITSVVDGRPEQVLRVPGNSWWPFLAAIATGGFFIGATFHAWVTTAVSAVLAFVLILRWVWDTAEIPEKNQRDAGCGYVLPLYVSGPQSVGWWAMFITLLGDGTAFVSLIFAYFFFWTVHPQWPPAMVGEHDLLLPAPAFPLLMLAVGLIRYAVVALRGARTGRFKLAVWLGSASLLVFGGLELLWLFASNLDPTAHSYPAIVWTILLYLLLHMALGVVMGIYVLARFRAGRLAPGYDIDLRNVALFWYFVVFMGVLAMATVHLFPLAS